MPAEHAPRATGPATRRPPPPHAVMGLIDYLTKSSLDEDYAVASERRKREAARAATEPPEEEPPRRARRSRAHVAALVVLGIFGLMVATAAVQTSRTAVDRQQRHDELVQQIADRKQRLTRLRARADNLTRETDTLQTLTLQATAQGRALQSRITRLSLVDGASAVRGPGVRIVARNGPASSGDKGVILDIDLQKMANGLWLSGAEAIAINGQRLTNLSAIRQGGDTITIGYRRISPPYTIDAIGNPDSLAARFVDTPGGQWWLDLQALYGVGFEINSKESLTLPAASRLSLRHAHTPEKLR